MGIANHIKSADWETEKHVPAIVLPETVKHGEPFDVEVSVGKGVPHPNTVEHHIAWIALYYLPDGGLFPIELGRADLSAHGAVSTAPVAKFRVALDKPGKLLAVAYCNLHGLWEGESSV